MHKTTKQTLNRSLLREVCLNVRSLLLKWVAGVILMSNNEKKLSNLKLYNPGRGGGGCVQGRSQLDNWGGMIFIYSGSAQLISIEINCFYGL